MRNLKGQVFHVAGGAFRGCAALGGFFGDGSHSASGSVCPVLSCNLVSRVDCRGDDWGRRGSQPRFIPKEQILLATV